jgi:hypothetical protein
MNKEKELYNKMKFFNTNIQIIEKPIIKNKSIIENISTTLDTSGRFANHFIRNMAAHILSKKYNLKFIYSYYNEIKELGIDLFIDGINSYNETIGIYDANLMDYINNIIINKNIIMNDCYQSKEFILYLKKYFDDNNLFEQVKIKNIYNSKYNKNNDMFVHVRLGDILISNNNLPFEYYDNIISTMKFENGYISSDTINHEICQKLINKYNLIKIELNEIQTIMYGSTCKYIVLSEGTFSWLIGFLGIYSKVYVPKNNRWHGDIFVLPEWIKS